MSASLGRRPLGWKYSTLTPLGMISNSARKYLLIACTTGRLTAMRAASRSSRGWSRRRNAQYPGERRNQVWNVPTTGSPMRHAALEATRPRVGARASCRCTTSAPVSRNTAVIRRLSPKPVVMRANEPLL